MTSLLGLGTKKLWVKIGENGTPSQVPTKDCDNVDDFKKAIRAEFSPLLNNYAASQFDLYIQGQDKLLTPGQQLSMLPKVVGSNENTALIVIVPEAQQQSTTAGGISTSISSFWKGVASSKPDIDNQTWKFADEQCMYIRKSYIDLYDDIVSTEFRAILVTGNPGTGKSWFSYFLLNQLVTAGKTVVYQSMGSEVYILVKNGKVMFGDIDRPRAFQEELSDRNNYYICDHAKNSKYNMHYRVEAKHISVASNPMSLDTFKRENARSLKRVVNPCWLWDEIDSFATTLSKNELQDRFRVFGGIPRYIFSGDASVFRNDLDTAIQDCNLDSIINLMKAPAELSSYGENSHFILHFRVPNYDVDVILNNDVMHDDEITLQTDYTKSVTSFASEYVVEKMRQKYIESKKKKWHDLLIYCKDESSIGALFGDMFEPYARDVLSSGGDFAVRNLITGDQYVLHLKKRERRVYRSYTVLDTEARFYNSPYSEIEGAIDDCLMFDPGQDSCKQGDQLVITVPTLFLLQMTRNMYHGTIPHYVHNYMRHFWPQATTRGAKTKLIFVIPDNKFDSFPKQRYVNSSSGRKRKKTSTSFAELSISDDEMAKEPKGLEQWALCIPLTDANFV